MRPGPITAGPRGGLAARRFAVKIRGVSGATYSSAGVNLELYREGMARLPAHMRRTQCPRVMSQEGGFAALFALVLPGLFARGYVDPLLVSCSDGVGTKLKHQGFEMWRKCIDGDERAWATMKRYNIQDVRLTERVYDRLRPWIKNHPHPGLYGGDVEGCPNCGGTLAPVPDRTTNTASRVYALLRCVDCGANARPAKSTGLTTATRAV
jgi:hypothetical protein